MSKQSINIGTLPSDGSGDPIRVAFDKINSNFTELYAAGGLSGFSGYSGAQGPAGGASGYSGFSSSVPGSSGFSGFSGQPGGYSGYSGLSGYSGANGTSGYSGVSGRSGYSGTGISGRSGFSGVSGFSGNSHTPISTSAIYFGNGTTTLAYSKDAVYTAVASMGPTTWSITGLTAAGTVNRWTLELTNGGAYAQTWFPQTKWDKGIAPTLTAAGKDILFFYSIDGGNTVVGILLATDVK